MWTLPAAQYQATASPAPASASNDDTRARAVPCHANGGVQLTASPAGIPDPPRVLPEIERMEAQELQSILAEPAKFEHYIATHAHTRTAEAILAPLRQEVEVLEARKSNEMNQLAQNTVPEERVEELEAQLAALTEGVEALRKEQSDWMSRNTEYHLEVRLRALIEESERESQALQDQWNDGVIQYAEFIAQYLAVRSKIAERKLKLERFQEKLQRAKLTGSSSRR